MIKKQKNRFLKTLAIGKNLLVKEQRIGSIKLSNRAQSFKKVNTSPNNSTRLQQTQTK
jgi:hypothetical protein